MYLFIAIIFIAELIVAGFILYWIIKADKYVKSLDIKVAKFSPKLIESIQNTRYAVCSIQTAIDKILAFIKRKKIEFWRRVVNLIVIYLILNILKTKFKKAATYCEYAVFLKDCWDSIPG